MACIKFKQGDTVGFACGVNDTHYVMLDGKRRAFELTYFGPVPLKKNGDPMMGYPKGFYEAVEQHPAYKRWRKKVDAELKRQPTKLMY